MQPRWKDCVEGVTYKQELVTSFHHSLKDKPWVCMFVSVSPFPNFRWFLFPQTQDSNHQENKPMYQADCTNNFPKGNFLVSTRFKSVFLSGFFSAQLYIEIYANNRYKANANKTLNLHIK